jgi:glycerol-3-phosphate O-acyltransferase/dihydroxyacetone phosphate acyltransferase
MWLLPVFSGVCGIAVRVFYRFEVQGPSPPRTGPLLLVANHPNSLVDPALVTAAAGRPVRFLAKAPLFTHPLVGWLVRASGAIPVYRRSDDPSLTSRNEEMFAAVFAALSDGAAIGIFPEGLSHSHPSLADLKTGGARIALGFAARSGEPLDVVPTGLVLRDKGRFRSEALVVHGEPLGWADLDSCGEEDVEAVQELTRRLGAALQEVTINLESWEDQPLVEGAQSIWAAEIEPNTDEQDRLKRIQASASILQQMRRSPDPHSMALASEVTTHCRRLRRLGMEPRDLGARVDLRSAVRWTASRVVWLGPPATLVAVSGFLLYLIPYHVTGILTRAAKPPATQRSTYQILIGALIYTLWIVLVAVGVGTWLGIGWGALTCVLMPVIGVVGMWIRERWRGYWGDMRRFFLIRSRVDLIGQLQARQRDLAVKLDGLAQGWPQDA